MSKQLLMGLVIGAACTGLAVLMFSGASIPASAVSGTGNLKLLAQVIPNEVTPEVSEDGVPEVEAGVIEVRANLPVMQKTAPISLAIDEEPEEVAEHEPEAQVTLCSYVTDKEPEHDGVINEVAWMGSGDDPNAEWVEMQNRTKEDLDVSGWQLVDKAEQVRAVIPVGVVLPRNGFLLFERDPHQLPGATVLYKGVIANADEGLRLFDADCGLQDEVIAKPKWPAGTNKPKNTAERGKDLSWHTFYGDDEAGVLGTPGKKNSSGPPEPEPEPEVEQVAETPKPADDTTASSSEPDPEPEASAPIVITSGQIIISEVMAGSASSAGDEFIELYNTTNAEIDLTGFSIKKKVLSSGSESSLVTTVNFEGKKVGAGQRFIIGHGGFSAQTQMTWSTSYSVAYTGNAALLYNTQGEKIDEVSWELSAGQSYACAGQGSCAVQEAPNPGN